MKNASPSILSTMALLIAFFAGNSLYAGNFGLIRCYGWLKSMVSGQQSQQNPHPKFAVEKKMVVVLTDADQVEISVQEREPTPKLDLTPQEEKVFREYFKRPSSLDFFVLGGGVTQHFVTSNSSRLTASTIEDPGTIKITGPGSTHGLEIKLPANVRRMGWNEAGEVLAVELESERSC